MDSEDAKSGVAPRASHLGRHSGGSSEACGAGGPARVWGAVGLGSGNPMGALVVIRLVLRRKQGPF